MTKAHPGRVFIAIAVLALACVAASSASALDAFWRGERSLFWEHGINSIDGKSNWYSHPQGGEARGVPDARAVFTGDAQEFQVSIGGRTLIGTIAIRNDAPRYDFIIRRNAIFSLTTGGVANASPNGVSFQIRQAGMLWVEGEARLISRARNSNIDVLRGGSMTFFEDAGGGNFAIKNKGELLFTDWTTGERASIENGDPLSGGVIADLIFAKNSTGGEATILNRKNGRLLFPSNGLGDDGRVTAGRITNEWQMGIGTRTLIIEHNFVQRADGTLNIEVEPGRAGNIIAKGPARIAGTLFVRPFAGPVPPGSYRVLHAAGGLTGTFVLTSFVSNSRLVHTRTSVFLVVDP